MASLRGGPGGPVTALRFTFVTDGASDRALLPVLTWLLRQHSQRPFQPQWADLLYLRQPPRTLEDKIITALELYPCDLLFVHRDAEPSPRRGQPTWNHGSFSATAPPARRDSRSQGAPLQDAVLGERLASGETESVPPLRANSSIGRADRRLFPFAGVDGLPGFGGRPESFSHGTALGMTKPGFEPSDLVTMSRPLLPTDLLERDPAAQVVPLPEDRGLVRHAAGITLLRGVAEDDLRRILDLVDGSRTVQKICAALADELDPEAVRRLLSSLVGDLLRIIPSAETEPAPRVFLMADAAVRDRFAASLSLTPDLAGARLAVAALAETAYRDLLDLQARWLAAGVPSLFVTADPDGLRIGPLTIPGASPCFACSQLAALGALRLSPDETLAAAAGFRTGALDGPTLDRAVERLAAEIRAFLDPQGTPELLSTV